MRKLCTAGNLPKGSLWTCLIDHCSGKKPHTLGFFFRVSDALSSVCWEIHQALCQDLLWDPWLHCDLVQRVSCSTIQRSLGVAKPVFKSHPSCFSTFYNEVSDSAPYVVSSCHVPQFAAQLTLSQLQANGPFGLPGFSLALLSCILHPEGEFLGFTWLWAVGFLWHDFLAFDSSASLKATRI